MTLARRMSVAGKRRAWVLALLLPLFSTGCMATGWVAQNVGRNKDGHPQYTALYSDGNQLVVSYTSYPTPNSPRRWAEIDLRGMEWGPLGVIDLPKAVAFMPRFEALKPERIGGLKEISRYAAAPPHVEWNKADYANTGLKVADRNQIESGEAHRDDPDRLPFTAYLMDDNRGTLVLIRDDPDQPGHYQALKLVPENDLHPAARWATYPFSVTLDVVTLPLQVLYGAAKVMQMAANH